MRIDHKKFVNYKDLYEWHFIDYWNNCQMINQKSIMQVIMRWFPISYARQSHDLDMFFLMMFVLYNSSKFFGKGRRKFPYMRGL